MCCSVVINICVCILRVVLIALETNFLGIWNEVPLCLKDFRMKWYKRKFVEIYWVLEVFTTTRLNAYQKGEKPRGDSGVVRMDPLCFLAYWSSFYMPPRCQKEPSWCYPSSRGHIIRSGAETEFTVCFNAFNRPYQALVQTVQLFHSCSLFIKASEHFGLLSSFFFSLSHSLKLNKHCTVSTAILHPFRIGGNSNQLALVRSGWVFFLGLSGGKFPPPPKKKNQIPQNYKWTMPKLNS